MGKRKKLRVVYKSLWDTATPKQKQELAERLDHAFDMIFRKILAKERQKNL